MPAKPISRRHFLKIAGAALGVSTLACCGLGYAATRKPPAKPKPAVETPSFSFGKDDPMKDKLLVAYATRTGSTVGVATAIGETLAERGYAVDVKPFREDPDPTGYPTVILGSAVNGAKWLPEAVDYVRNHQQALQQAKVALFCVHIMNQGDDETSCRNRLAYLNEVRPLVASGEEVWFTGIGMDPDEESFLVRWIYRTFKIGTEGDCRDWNKIRGWAQTVFA